MTTKEIFKVRLQFHDRMISKIEFRNLSLLLIDHFSKDYSTFELTLPENVITKVCIFLNLQLIK
jgi:hypothetical protein